MHNLNPLHIAGARAGQAHFRRRARIGRSEIEAFCAATGLRYRPDLGETCPTNTPVSAPPYNGGQGYGTGQGYDSPGYTPPPGPRPPFQCWDGSFAESPNFCPAQPPQVGPPIAPPVSVPTPVPTPTIPQSGGPSGCAPVCNVCPENQKRYYMPFVPDAGYTASVTAGNQVRFVGKPQKLFAPDRLIIASSIAPYFDIVQLIIGNTPQSLSQGNVSAEMFSEVATYVMMTFDQAYPGIDVIIVAQNKSSVTQTFQAQLVGEAVQG